MSSPQLAQKLAVATTISKRVPVRTRCLIHALTVQVEFQVFEYATNRDLALLFKRLNLSLS